MFMFENPEVVNEVFHQNESGLQKLCEVRLLQKIVELGYFAGSTQPRFEVWSWSHAKHNRQYYYLQDESHLYT